MVPRRHERHAAHGLSCELGEVVDLSASGMKLNCAKKPTVKRGDVLEFSLRSSQQRINVQGRVVWTRRQSWREHRVGVQFINLKPGVSEALVEFALHGFISPKQKAAAAAAGPGPQDHARPRTTASVEVEDLYRILGVPRNAPVKAVNEAFRLAARKYHPDVCKEPDAEQRFAEISKAYSVLRDTEKRQRYDDLVANSAP
ncbi:MAG: DnaJ domain-containing protein [Phycisphaerales bacterium]